MNSINLLYVGTLTGRDIYKAVEFIHEFIMQSGADVKFNIIGDGEDYDKIEHYVNKHSIHNRIILHGYVKQTELYKYYEISNVGLAYVPITDFYRFQPATKVYEYLASGLFVIASNYTSFDGLIKHKINGYIIDNSKESVFDAINFILNNLDYLNISKDIETKYYSWENVIYTQLYKTLNI